MRDITNDHCDGYYHPSHSQSTAAQNEPDERHIFRKLLLKILDLHKWLPPQERNRPERMHMALIMFGYVGCHLYMHMKVFFSNAKNRIGESLQQ